MLGATLLVRTGPQVRALEQGFAQAAARVVAFEQSRMGRVNRNWRTIKAVETVLIALGIVFIVFGRSRGITWPAVGTGLVIEATAMWIFDVLAERRALRYTAWLSQVLP